MEENIKKTKWEKVRTFINKIFTPIMTILILLISCWIITVILTGGKWYYYWQFEKNNTINIISYDFYDENHKIKRMAYTEEDLKEIGDTIVDYLLDKKDDMQVIVTIDGTDYEVFSNQALHHMAAVKALYWRWTYMTLACMIIFILGLVYMIKYFNELRPTLFKKTWITYSVIGGILLIVAVMMLINFDWTFTMFHHILFPKISDFNDAFFGIVSNYEEKSYINNYTLVRVLSIGVFMDAAWIILTFMLLTLSGWFTFTFVKGKLYYKALKQEELSENINV